MVRGQYRERPHAYNRSLPLPVLTVYSLLSIYCRIVNHK